MKKFLEIFLFAHSFRVNCRINFISDKNFVDFFSYGPLRMALTYGPYVWPVNLLFCFCVGHAPSPPSPPTANEQNLADRKTVQNTRTQHFVIVIRGVNRAEISGPARKIVFSARPAINVL